MPNWSHQRLEHAEHFARERGKICTVQRAQRFMAREQRKVDKIGERTFTLNHLTSPLSGNLTGGAKQIEHAFCLQEEA
jgi:hypothetical protein